MFGKYLSEVMAMNTHFSDREVREAVYAMMIVISVKIVVNA